MATTADFLAGEQFDGHGYAALCCLRASSVVPEHPTAYSSSQV
jgi:hypothetical protein